MPLTVSESSVLKRYEVVELTDLTYSLYYDLMVSILFSNWLPQAIRTTHACILRLMSPA